MPLAPTFDDFLIAAIGVLSNPWLTALLPFGLHFFRDDNSSFSILENQVMGPIILPYWISITLSTAVKRSICLFLLALWIRVMRRKSRIAMNNGVFDDRWVWPQEIAVVTGGTSFL